MATGRTHRPATRSRGIPEATVARLPLYLRALTALSERSVPTVSSEELAAAEPANTGFRRDVSIFYGRLADLFRSAGRVGVQRARSKCAPSAS